MSFASPMWLLALLAVPIAVGLYLLVRRRAKRYAIRFTAVPTVREALGATPGWQRHLPLALLMAAIAALALALARPHQSYQTPIDQASMMLVEDHSGSMAATDVQPTRLAAAQKAANTFIDQLPSNSKVGAVAFSSSPDAVQGPATNHDAARSIINGEAADGATATGNALQLALQLLQGANPKHPPSAIVLLSDGAANTGIDPTAVAGQARRDRVPIYTVALGTPNGVLQSPGGLSPPQSVPPDPALMQTIAKDSGGKAFDAQSSDVLSSIYKSLGSKLGSVTRKRDITYEFAVAGVLLLLAGVGVAVRYSGRLP